MSQVGSALSGLVGLFLLIDFQSERPSLIASEHPPTLIPGESAAVCNDQGESLGAIQVAFNLATNHVKFADVRANLRFLQISG